MRMGQAGDGVSARAQVEDEPDVLARGDLPRLVALEPSEGAPVQYPVHDQQRVDVPGVGHGVVSPRPPQWLDGTAGDAPYGVVPARADVDGALVPAGVVGVADGIEAPVAAQPAGVVRQELAGAGLLPGRTEDAPEPAPAHGDARRGEVIERFWG